MKDCRIRRQLCAAATLLAVVCSVSPAARAQSAPAPAAAAKPQNAPVIPVGGITPPADYVIGPNDVLSVMFWRDKDMSADVTVRPDGKISLLLLNDVQAGGLTPEQLGVEIEKAAAKFVEDPTVTVQVKAINSRKVFISGQIGKPGEYPLGGPTTVLQLIAQAGGVLEYADSSKIQVNRVESGKPVSIRVNYKDIERGRNLQQNILLKPGDVVLVP
ncbi:MAG TPA: polysaccharide biosynthesis/export family protein [Gemmatimonadaceae bacterium]